MALLLVGVAVGLRGGFAAPGLRGPLRHDGIGVGAGLEAVLAILLIALLVRQRRQPHGRLRHPPAAHRAPRRAAGRAGRDPAGPAGVPRRCAASRRPSRAPVLRLPAAPSVRPTRLFRPAPVHLPLAALLYTLLGIVLLAAVVACVVLLRRRPALHGTLPPDEASLADGERTDLRDAVESGQRALARLDDARAAIIACYLAMERSLAAAGADRTEADTPAEFLARAVAAGLVRTAAAGQLTGLFYEARFSRHELTGAERSAAEAGPAPARRRPGRAKGRGADGPTELGGTTRARGRRRAGRASEAGWKAEWGGGGGRGPGGSKRAASSRPSRSPRPRPATRWPGPRPWRWSPCSAAAGGLVLLRSLVPPQPAAAQGNDLTGPDPAVPPPVLSAFTGNWRRQSRLADAQAARTAYEAGLRPQLEHLLASRLAERHGISLYDDPAASPGRVHPRPARLRRPVDLDRPGPARPSPGTDPPGIPRRTLARLIDRLERL